MKGMKKLLSILMVLTLVLSLGVTAFAATANVTISPAKDGVTHTYKAYQIFSGTDQAAGEGPISNLTWGDGIDVDSFVNALIKDLSDKFTEENTQTDGKFDAQKVAKVLSTLSDDSAELKKVAEAARQNVSEANAKTIDGSTELLTGYYVIIDTTSVAGQDAVKNSVVLEVTQNVTVTFKTDIPSSDKKVKDKNDSNPSDHTTNGDWGTTADYDIGDQVPFQLTATIPAGTTTAYQAYKLIFHDKEEQGLTFNKGSVKVYYKVNDETDSYELTSGFKILTEGTDDITNGTCTFEIKFDDIKTAIGSGFNPANKYTIFVEYTSELKDDAVIGNPGNHNKMQLEFSNDYTNNGTGKDQEKEVVVFTYDLNVDKVDQDSNPLSGAEFKLYKVVTEKGTDGKEPSEVPQLKDVTTLTGKYLKPVNLTKNSAGDSFYGKGLDDGDYWIIETTTPPGYNTMDPKSFTITAEHGNTITSLKGNDDFQFKLTRTGSTENEKALGQADIKNQKGVTLPETGGIGTTIFYVAGAILVAGAVILLVTKKRVSGTEK